MLSLSKRQLVDPMIKISNKMLYFLVLTMMERMKRNVDQERRHESVIFVIKSLLTGVVYGNIEGYTQEKSHLYVPCVTKGLLEWVI